MMGVSIYKRGRVYWILVRSQGQRLRWSLGTKDRKVALEARKLCETRLARGEPLRGALASDVPTFKAYAAGWLERKELSGRKSTVDGYRHAVAEVMPLLGALRMTQVTRTHAREVATVLAQGGRGSRGAKTVANRLGDLQSLFTDAMDELRDEQGRARILENPFSSKARLVAGLALETRDLEDPDAIPRPYTDAEIERLLAAPELAPRDRLKILWGLDAGLRRSEVFGLHRTDLELEQAWTWIRRRISRGEVGRPKTARSMRRVPLTDRLIAETRAHLVSVGLGAIALFPPLRALPASLGYEDAVRFHGRFLAALQAAGVDPGEHPFHRLRHTFCSRLLAAGSAPYLVSKWAGHASTAFTEQRYAQWIPGSGHRTEVNRGHGLATLWPQSTPGDGSCTS